MLYNPIISRLIPPLSIFLILSAISYPILAAPPSNPMVALHDGHVTGYYGSVYAVTPDRIQRDNQTLKQLGVNYAVSTPSQSNPGSPVVEVDAADRRDTPPKPKVRRGITMAEYVANHVRNTQSNHEEEMVVASLDEL